MKSRKTIGLMFRKGKSFGMYPLRLIWQEMPQSEEQGASIQLAVAVPKKNFPHATDRNLMRRRVREAYRINKYFIYEKMQGTGRNFAWMVLYTGKEASDYQEIESKMRRLLRKFWQETLKDAARP